jgi:ubiquinone/menaquinone biosynthesis C-methylase UbiE
MSEGPNPVVETYSRLAALYDEERNQNSCWGRATKEALAGLVLSGRHRRVADVGCGTGRALVELAARCDTGVEFVGVEPARAMRERARAHTAHLRNVRVLDGAFEQLPLETDSVDYLYSLMAFHWVTDARRAVAEVARVLRAEGELDLVFIGRRNGREFIRKTTPVFMRHMGPALLLRSAAMRKQFTLEEARALFAEAFAGPELSVRESFDTYYDTLEGHWGWWVRIEGQFLDIPPERKEACDREVRAALAELETGRGIPYTIHSLHVRVRRQA